MSDELIRQQLHLRTQEFAQDLRQQHAWQPPPSDTDLNIRANNVRNHNRPCGDALIERQCDYGYCKTTGVPKIRVGVDDGCMYSYCSWYCFSQHLRNLMGDNSTVGLCISVNSGNLGNGLPPFINAVENMAKELSRGWDIVEDK
jgi:hypothetical protein